MRKNTASVVMSAALCVGAATHLTLMPGCATVANDPVGTNAARYVQTANIARSSYIAWASVLEADVHRVTPIITPEKRESVKQIRIEIDTLLGEWNRSVSAGEAFSGIDSLFSLLDALARLTTEAAR